MTDQERKAMEMALEALEWSWGGEPMGTKEIEAITALRQALAQGEQEPVAWVLHRELFWPSEYEVISEDGDNAIPLYTAPPRKPWVELTNDEAAECWSTSAIMTWRRIQDKLKEKNYG